MRKTKNIVLVCANGASTSILERNIQKAIEKNNLDVTVKSYSVTTVGKAIQTADIVLLGPQIAYVKKDLIKQYPEKASVMQIIDSIDYGMLDGEKILQKAMSLIQ